MAGSRRPGGQQLRLLGEPPKEIVEADGLHLVGYNAAVASDQES